MSFLKRFFSKKEIDNNSIIKGFDNNSLIKHSITANQPFNNIENYQNNLTWWNNLPEDWKRFLLSPNSYYVLDPNIDITEVPTDEFLKKIIAYETFCSNWIPLKTIEPLNAMKSLNKLLLESINIKNFNEISTLKNITVIHAGFSTLESLDGLENFDQLEQITLANTDITTLKPIATLPKIKDLDIRGTLICPVEYELFMQLHPNATIDFITPMNPLRRSKESLENPILDYYKSLIKS